MRLGLHAYLYRFDGPPAAHAQELDYVFGWPSGGVSERYPREAPVPPWPSTIEAVQGYWARFALRAFRTTLRGLRGARLLRTLPRVS